MTPAFVLRCSLLLALAIASAGAVCCNANPQQQAPSPGPSGSAVTYRAMPAPAGAEIIALLDGLSVGQKIGGVSVAAIGAIDSRGTIPAVIEQGGAISMIVVAARTETPVPPVNTVSYSVFYERFDSRNGVPQAQLMDALRDIAARLTNTEKKLPVPAGLKALARSGSPA